MEISEEVGWRTGERRGTNRAEEREREKEREVFLVLLLGHKAQTPVDLRVRGISCLSLAVFRVHGRNFFLLFAFFFECAGPNSILDSTPPIRPAHILSFSAFSL